MRYAIKIQYLGTNYCGWQKQINGISVQSVLEKALSKLIGENITIYGSGRTDAGVHALGQVAHFDADTSIPAERMSYAVNGYLPDDIRVIDCKAVDENFHARLSAKQKTYAYSLYIAPHKNPLYITAVHLSKPLNLKDMKEAAKLIIGKHDFKCFSATGSSVKTTVRTIYDIDIKSQDNMITISITGDGFLYNMVRIIVGTLIDVGYRKTKPDYINTIISSGDRKKAGKTMPAYGLCLKEVKYR